MQAISKTQLDTVIAEIESESINNILAENQIGFQMALDLLKQKFAQQMSPVEIEVEIIRDGVQILPKLSKELQTGPIGFDSMDIESQVAGFFLNDEIISLIGEELCDLNVTVSTTFSDPSVQQLCTRIAALLLELSAGMERQIYRESISLIDVSANKVKSVYVKNFPSETWNYEW